MKSLTTFFSGILLLFVVFQCGYVQAIDPRPVPQRLPVYQDVIKNISLGYDGKMLVGDLELETGLHMRIVDYKTRDDNVIKTWKRGDVVAFKSHVKKDALILSVKRINAIDEEVEPYVIADVTKDNDQYAGLRIEEVKNGEEIRLSDGSVWKFGFWNHFTTKHWTSGQRVLVFGRGDKDSYEFINLDAPVQDDTACAVGTYLFR